MTTRKTNAKDFLDFISGKKVFTFVQDSIDPDAIACAMAVSYLSGYENQIIHNGKASHPQNKIMINLLNFQAIKIDSWDQIPDDSILCLVDANAIGTGVIKQLKGNPRCLDIIVDHHNLPANYQSPMCMEHIERVGACSTLFAEYLLEEHVDNGRQIPSDLATALLVGIQTDTNNFGSVNTTVRDFNAFKELWDFKDTEKFNQIMDFKLPRPLFEVKAKSSAKLSYVASIGYCGMGFLPESQRDAIPILANEILSVEGVETSIVYGIVGDSLVASIRTTDNSIEINSFAQSLFGKNAGGKYGAGGATIPLDFFCPSDSAKDSVWESIELLVKEKIERLLK